MKFNLREKELIFDRTYIMGILNITPDSFYDGGKFFSFEKAIEQANKIINDGADIIDIGGESTRPGAKRISAEEEINRIIPVIDAIRKYNKEILISVDTYKSEVAKEAIEHGADIVNDISGGMFDEDIFKIVTKYNVGYVIMHIQGTPEIMQINPVYSENGVVNDIINYFKERISIAANYGININKIILDPGIGFGKTFEHNLEILNNLDKFKQFNLPILIGTSRKSFIGKILNKEPENRLYGTIASVVLSIVKGANIVRVHDVKEVKDAVFVADAILKNNNCEKVTEK